MWQRTIHIDDGPRPTAESLGETILRLMTGAVLVALGGLQLMARAHWQGIASAYQLPEPELVVAGFITGHVLVGMLLMAGAFTRLAALLALGLIGVVATVSTLNAASARFVNHESDILLHGLLVTSVLYFALVGGGRWSLDTIRRKRAQRRAIEEDEIWQRPPYVPLSGNERTS